jgi:hypothetical protein
MSNRAKQGIAVGLAFAAIGAGAVFLVTTTGLTRVLGIAASAITFVLFAVLWDMYRGEAEGEGAGMGES